MGNQPVYRYPPRSHARNCPCARCVQCRSRPSPGSGLITFDMGCLGVVLVFAAVSGIAGWVARNSHAALAVLSGAGVLALVICAVVFANRRAVRPPEGRLRVEVFPDGPPAVPAPPAPPACLHLDAVKVDSSVVPGLIWRCWCPDCETGLPAGFRLPCCGAEPGGGTQPGRHAYNCPHLKGSPS